MVTESNGMGAHWNVCSPRWSTATVQAYSADIIVAEKPLLGGLQQCSRKGQGRCQPGTFDLKFD